MAKKFDVFSWDEVKTNEKIQIAKGTLVLQLSTPCPVYASQAGYEVLLGFASHYEVEFSEETLIEIAAPKGARAFKYNAMPTAIVDSGESWTNIDRQPYESGALAEVTKARRQLEIEKRQMLREIRQEAAMARASMRESNMTKGQKATAEEMTDVEITNAKAQAEQLADQEAQIDDKPNT